MVPQQLLGAIWMLTLVSVMPDTIQTLLFLPTNYCRWIQELSDIRYSVKTKCYVNNYLHYLPALKYCCLVIEYMFTHNMSMMAVDAIPRNIRHASQLVQ